MEKETKTFNYWCANRGKCPDCVHCDKIGDLQIQHEVEIRERQVVSPTEPLFCPSAEEEIPLKLMGMAVPKMSITKLTDAQIKVDRRQRSRQHFEREIFDTLPTEDKRIFARKDPKLAKRMK